MKMKRYRVNVRETALQPREKQRNLQYKPRGLYKAFNKGGIPVLVESSKAPKIKNRVCVK